jgi:hypothetical protein
MERDNRGLPFALAANLDALSVTSAEAPNLPVWIGGGRDRRRSHTDSRQWPDNPADRRRRMSRLQFRISNTSWLWSPARSFLLSCNANRIPLQKQSHETAV